MIKIRNRLIGKAYCGILRPLYFKIDPEKIHERMVRFGRFLGDYRAARVMTRWLFDYSDERLRQDILGMQFINPIGLAAGFDKNAELTNILPAVGFGFMEVGSVTGEPCPGNPGPRLWRAKNSGGLLVYYGLKNHGAAVIAERLKNKGFQIPLGISIAKTNSPAAVETVAGINDYVKAARQFIDIGDYLTINISCPNAYGGQPFTDPARLDLLLTEIDKIKISKPIFLKMPPDLSEQELDAIIKTVNKHCVQGFVCTNLTKQRVNLHPADRDLPACGGLSGRPVQAAALKCVRELYKKTRGRYVIIGVGGVFSPVDAYKMIKSGASLIQLITGMIYQGPQLIAEINQGLVELLAADGFQNISQAVGADNSG